MQTTFFWRTSAATLLALVVAACGDTTALPASEPKAPTPVAQPTPVGGTVATGAALANAAVTLYCNNGGAPVSATSNAAGKYTGTLPTGCVAPYAFKATGLDTSVSPNTTVTLHGFSDARSNVNITPLTDIVSRIVTGGDPVAAFTAIASGSKKASDFWNPSSGADARTKLADLMAKMNISTAGLTDLLHQPFSATQGDALDNILESVKLQRGAVTLAALAEIVGKFGGTVQDKPWDVLFPVGVNRITLSASDCVLSTNGTNVSVTTAAITISRGASTVSLKIVPNAVDSSEVIPPVVVGASPTGSSFDLYASYATRTFVQPGFSEQSATGSSNAYFDTNQGRSPPAATFEQSFYFSSYQSGSFKTFQCNKMNNPTTVQSLVNFQPQARLATLIAGTPTARVWSDGYCTASYIGPPVIVAPPPNTYTYTVSVLGDIKLNDVSVPPGWLSSAAFPAGFYSERVNYQGALTSQYEIQLETQPEKGVIVRRYNLIPDPQTPTVPTFQHSCSFNQG
jgi:hypothetical protein